MPRLAIPWQDISPEQWTDCLAKFTDRSWSRWLPLPGPQPPSRFLLRLLSIFQSIKEGEPWPEQLAEGHIIGLPKHSQAQAITDYRPVVIVSILYRAWSSLRARQVLSILGPVVHSGAKGFLLTALRTSVPSQKLLKKIASQSHRAWTTKEPTAWDILELDRKTEGQDDHRHLQPTWG